MDPVGPWYATYNRLTAASATNTFQSTPSSTSSDFVSHHLATAVTQAVPSTTSQLILQAAHTTATLAGQPSPFNPGGFLSPPPVGYDVFSPLFHHPNPKQAHYVTQHRQALAQAQAVSVTKQNTTTEPDIPILRENYSSAHQPTFFEHQSATTSPTSTLAWTHQNNTQLPSPFGILPHESIVPSSPGPSPTTKPTTTGVYENTFNPHFSTSQTINNINSQLPSPAVSASEFKPANYPDSKKAINVKPAVSTSQASSNQTFFQQVPTTFSSETLSNSYSATNGNQTPNGKVQQPPLQHQQQSCIVSTSTRNNNFTSPPNKITTTSQQRSDSEYHHSGRSKSTASTDSAYSSNNSAQSGPDCSVVVPRRPSPLQAHSQASPLGHVPSPAYPMYNSPMAAMSSPSPLQQHAENNGNQCASGPPYKGTVQQQVTPPSPLDVTVPRPASQGQVVYSSVITRALGTTETKTTYNADNKTYDRQQHDFPQTQKQICWENDNRNPIANRKFSVALYTGGNAEVNPQSLPVQQQVQRVINVSDRQQAYFESNQVTLQDLSSCRGDPMSIVKNLQTLQQSSCQVQQQAAASVTSTEQQKQTEERRKVDTVNKKRKNVEKMDPLLLPPRRETSRRKAKEKTSVKQFLDRQQGIDYFDIDEEQGDSDSDPAWTPAVKLVGDEEEKKKKRGRPVISKKSKKIIEDSVYCPGTVVVSKSKTRKKHESKSHSKISSVTGKLSCKIDEKLIASVSDEDIDISPFKSGEFVVMKTDLDEEYPALWRIDGKTLLQKYEPFKSNGKTLYRNISTYSGWAPQNRHIYQQVPVKFWQQGKTETVVEFLRNEMIIDDNEGIEKYMKETEKFQDNFEVYIQTLISQALDSNFLTEIFQEQDDYFLSNVKTVDEVTDERKRRLLSTTKWRLNVVNAISTWPCLNVLKDLSSIEYKGKSCAGCQQSKIHARVLLYGQPYNGTTLEGSPPDPRIPQEKDFLLCRVCQAKVALYNKVAHQKYLMFLECARRVADKRAADPNKDTTIILNELLADETWLNQLFKEVRTIWAEISSLEQQAKSRSNPKSTFSSSVYNSGETTENVSTTQTETTVETSDSQVPTQKTGENSDTVSCEVQMNNITS
ncbi:Glutamine and serine-rich protein 1 [Dufourea novaeangliae]|uniref:Glutamine and serine-rich protein 1 n=1 Tax=Dufourea novaeangliae TaxID=178035 RepID=A0A154PL27_DUFNO|nr:Glutamine and serine-rich protein 1 [Dufourea novaeangliae]